MKIICLDFDGVIHSYEKGWQDGSIYGTLTPGFTAWAKEARLRFDLHIYSSRSRQPEQRYAMFEWLRKQFALEMSEDEALLLALSFKFSDTKPPAFLTIDDRAITFKGSWSDSALALDAIDNFKPWNNK